MIGEVLLFKINALARLTDGRKTSLILFPPLP
jgi:hypothetical protein